jgi:hypothetical protein
MKAKTIFMTLLAVAAAGVMVSALIGGRPPEKKSPEPTAAAPEKVEAAPPAVPAEALAVAAPEKTSDVSVAQKKLPAAAAAKKQNSGSATKPKDPIQDQDARTALSLVGADPAAEEYWAAAINDPNLSANERKDLIEDLNEDGLSDPKHPGPQDLPLIANRLRLIEELAPSAMDAVNADAFAEAYKDLNNMLAGQPVQ